MSQDGRAQRIKVDIRGAGVPEKKVCCGSTIYLGPGGKKFRKCGSGHIHCIACGGYARKYGRTNYSCKNNCKG